MVTDPPYGVNYDPEWRKRARANNSERMGTVAYDDRVGSVVGSLSPRTIAYLSKWCEDPCGGNPRRAVPPPTMAGLYSGGKKMDKTDRWAARAPHPSDLPRSSWTGKKRASAATFGLSPGQNVGDYRLVELLGQGAMGQVWRAHPGKLGERPVALKVVRPHRAALGYPHDLACEAIAAGRLRHEGLVRVLDFGIQDELVWIAMELVEGGWTLRASIDSLRATQVSADHERRAAELFATIAATVQAAHAAGLVHRDLKPSSILLTPEGRPRISDFGLARLQEEAALFGDLAGTLAYVSPEQLGERSKRAGPSSDVFALGVMLYELLTFECPFRGDTHAEIARRILTEDPVALRDRRERIPGDLELITLKALRKGRTERYRSAGELALDLHRFLADEPIEAQPRSALKRTIRWIRRKVTPGVARGSTTSRSRAIIPL